MGGFIAVVYGALCYVLFLLAFLYAIGFIRKRTSSGRWTVQ